jgi:imidazolonepropionase-like amidohydrolase
MKKSINLMTCLVWSLTLAGSAMAQETKPVSMVLITNANILDSNKGTLTEDMSLLVEGNKIAKIAKSIPAPDGATVINAKGRTITPGLIDAHVHLVWNLGEVPMMYAAPDYLASLTLVSARETLMRGFTSVRDTTGPVLGVKKAIDQGYFDGPRIWASGAGISMTAGHADIKPYAQKPRPLGGWEWSDLESMGIAVLADGVPEVLAAARLQMRNGAAFLKMFTSGAVSGLYDPLDISEYSFDEIKAAADEAKRWNTYLAVHTYNDKATQAALEAGAMSIEHANLLSEETVKLIAQKGAFVSTQTGVYLQPAPASWNAEQKAKQKQAEEGLDSLFTLAKKYNVKIALGTDLVGSLEAKRLQAFELTNRLKWFTPAEILKQATVNNAELLSWSGPRNPYPGKLGVIEEGALADLLLVDGNPLENLKLFNEPDKNLLVIMKDGNIYKNTLGLIDN